MAQTHHLHSSADETASVMAIRSLSQLAEDISIYQTRMREGFDPKGPIVSGFKARLGVVLRQMPEGADASPAVRELRAEIENLLN